jgi:hypothetical protein
LVVPEPDAAKARGARSRGNEAIDASSENEPTTLEQLLDTLGDAPPEDEDSVSVDDIVSAVGRRSFGPLLLVTGLLAASPVSTIPGMPTTLGVLVALIAIQMLLRRERFWLPQWIVKRKISREKYCKGLGWMRKPAHFIDRFLKPRFEVVTNQGGLYAIALLCSFIGVAMPSLEVVPFSTHIAGIALTGFGLSLIAHDGLVGILALSLTASVVGSIVATVVF